MKRNYKEITNIDIEKLIVASKEAYSDERAAEKERLFEDLHERLEKLSQFEMEVIKLKFYSGGKVLSNLEISRMVNASPIKVWRTVKRAFRRMRDV